MNNTSEQQKATRTFKDIKTVVGIVKKVSPDFTWCTIQPVDQEGNPDGDYINLSCKKECCLPKNLVEGSEIACEYQMDIYWSNFANEYKTRRTIKGSVIII